MMQKTAVQAAFGGVRTQRATLHNPPLFERDPAKRGQLATTCGETRCFIEQFIVNPPPLPWDTTI